MTEHRKIGAPVLEVEDVFLAFGGVVALQGVSFDVREREIRAIIGPNGAGKSSMLNVINGVYHPQRGSVAFKGRRRRKVDPYEAAKLGVARTFQNIALFRGMSVLDNLMTGRNLKMRRNVLEQALYLGPARREELEHRKGSPPFCRTVHPTPMPQFSLPYCVERGNSIRNTKKRLTILSSPSTKSPPSIEIDAWPDTKP